MTNSRIEMPLSLRWAMAGFLFIGLASHGLALAAEPLRKVRMAIPSIVIDFAPLWIARERGIFRDERIDPEITYIQGNVRVVQSLVAGEVQFGIAGTAGAVSARAAGEEVIIVAVPMNRLDYTFVSRQPINKPADLTGKKVGIGAVGGSDEVATRIALEKLGVNPSSVTMLTVGGSGERLAALRAGSVDAATVGGATFRRVQQPAHRPHINWRALQQQTPAFNHNLYAFHARQDPSLHTPHGKTVSNQPPFGISTAISASNISLFLSGKSEAVYLFFLI